jgi:hypothetical protein
VVLTSIVLAAAAACSSGGSGTSTTSTSPSSGTGPTAPPQVRVETTEERTIDPAYRQGLARVDDRWIFSFNDGLFLTDDDLVKVGEVMPAIPSDWAAQGFNHIGDIDVAGGMVYAPVEQDDYGKAEQAMFRYDATSLQFIDAVTVPQHHNAWVTVDDEGIAYSMDEFSDDAVVRYDTKDGWRQLEPLPLTMPLERVQGGDAIDGVLWLSTDDETDGIYRVDLASGATTATGSMGHVEGEGEGIDATPLPIGDLHVISLAPDIVTVWLIHLGVRES